MRFVESLGAGVRLRLVAERTTAGSYWDPGVSKKLASCISTFACTGAKRRPLVPQVRQSISRMCAITHMAIYLKSLFQSYSMALSMNQTTQAILEEYFHLFRLYQSCYFSDTKHLMCHGLPCTVRECPVIRRRGFNRRPRQRSRSEFEHADCAALRTTHT